LKKALVFIWVLVFTFLFSNVFAQDKSLGKFYKIQLRVLDSLSGSPLSAATAQISKHRHFHFTDDNGLVKLDSVKSGLNLVQVSFVGYHSFEKVLDVRADMILEVLLCPTNFHLHEYTVHSHELTELGSENQSRIKLSALQIQRTSAMVFSDLFKQVPGMQTLSSGPAISKPIIRGLHSNRIALFNNGTKLESQSWGAEHGPEIDPFSASEIELIKGAASVEYGPEAIGGVIKISPKPYRQLDGIDGVVSMNAYSNNRAFAFSNLLNGTHGNKRHFNWRLQSSYKVGGDSKAPNYVISNTGFKETDLNFSSLYQVSEAFGIEITGSYFHNELGIMRAAHISSTSDLKKAISSSEPLIEFPFSYEINRPKQDVTHHILAAKLNYDYPQLGKIRLMYAYQMNHRMEYDRGVSWNPNSLTHTLPAYDLKLYSGNFDLQFEHKEFRKITGKIGASYLTQSNISSGTQKPIIPNFIAQTFGVFIFEKYKSGRWNIEAGARFDSRIQSVYQRISNTSINEINKNYSGLTFVASSAFHVSSEFQIQFTQSSAWRAPTVNELYSYGLHNGLASFEIGNENLVPEFAYNSDLAFKWKTDFVSIDFNLFKNTIKNFIYAKPDTSPTLTLRGAFPTFKFTQTNADLSGFEMQVAKPLSKRFLVNLSYSFLYANDVTNNQPLIYMPANRLKSSIVFNQSKWKYFIDVFSSVDFESVFRQNRFVEGLDYAAPPPAYFLINLQTAFTIQTKLSNISFVVGVRNLMNNSYRDYMNRFRYFTDEPGRNFYLSVQFPIQYYQSKKIKS
jgi:iron complex outermembrane receptor protein